MIAPLLVEVPAVMPALLTMELPQPVVVMLALLVTLRAPATVTVSLLAVSVRLN